MTSSPQESESSATSVEVGVVENSVCHPVRPDTRVTQMFLNAPGATSGTMVVPQICYTDEFSWYSSKKSAVQRLTGLARRSNSSTWGSLRGLATLKDYQPSTVWGDFPQKGKHSVATPVGNSTPPKNPKQEFKQMPSLRPHITNRNCLSKGHSSNASHGRGRK